MPEPKFTNELVNETSPYLLQHAHNPVQWHPWGEKALAKARSEDKPILLSIGYSACHWCHVMERESFEDEETAGLMNENFVNIKVDREERPDLDAIYMAVLQMMTGRGGWPMTLFLTPDQLPFFCGTYFPPEDLQGMPGFKRVLASVARAYKDQRQVIDRDAAAVVGELQKTNLLPGKKEPGNDILETALSGMVSGFDFENGGFGTAPKFPPAMALDFLMRSYRRSGNGLILEKVTLTLDRMAGGGIYDQLGGGFHRYSVDARWLVPHFEKMLYDNALLGRTYLGAYLLTGNEAYRKITEETLDYVAREMTSVEGGFYSSQDADSEGGEGAFFLWSVREIESILGSRDAEIFCRYYGVTPEGNFEGRNILHVPRPAGPVSRLNNVPEERLAEAVSHGRKLLFEMREKRARPGRDEKVLTAWNGLMLRSFAEAAGSLDREDYRRAAVRNADFLLSNLYRDGRLLRSYKDGRARLDAYLEDYAFLIDGLISLYESTFDSRWVSRSETLAEAMVSRFWDPREEGFYFTSKDQEPLIHRPKEFYDSVIPSGNSAAAYALLRLWKLTGRDQWRAHSVSILQRTSDLVTYHPSSFPNMLCALDFYLTQPREIAVIGDPADAGTKALLNEVFRVYCPNRVVACGTAGDLFLLRGKPQIDSSATAYVCRNFTCGLPVTSAGELRRGLLD